MQNVGSRLFKLPINYLKNYYFECNIDYTAKKLILVIKIKVFYLKL